MRRELDTIRSDRGRKFVGRRIEGQPRAPRRSIQSVIAQQYLIGCDNLGAAGAAACPLDTAHLEQVGEIAVEMQREVDRDRMIGVIAQLQTLMGGAAP